MFGGESKMKLYTKIQRFNIWFKTAQAHHIFRSTFYDNKFYLHKFKDKLSSFFSCFIVITHHHSLLFSFIDADREKKFKQTFFLLKFWITLIYTSLFFLLYIYIYFSCFFYIQKCTSPILFNIIIITFSCYI